MRRFISAVAGIVIAAIVVIGIGDYALQSLLKTSHTSLHKGSSTSISVGTTASNGAASSAKTGSGKSSSGKNSGTNRTVPSSTGNGTSSSISSEGGTVAAGSTLTSAQQSAMSSAIQTMLNNPSNEPKDCSAFVQYVYAQANLKLPRTVLQQANVGTRVASQNQLQYGDIVFFNLSPKQSQATFDGIYVGNGQFVADTTHGIHKIALSSSYWQPKFVYGVHG